MSANNYWDISSEVNSDERKQLILVVQSTENTNYDYVSVSEAGDIITVHYIAKDIISAIDDTSYIVSNYGRAILYGVLGHLYLGIDSEKAMIFNAKWEEIIRQTKRKVGHADVYGGQTMTEYDM